MKRNILVVEDDNEVREVIVDLLTVYGYKAEAVNNGKEALIYLRRVGEPCLVICDLLMPQVNGWELIKTMKEDPELSKMPIVVLTAYTKTNNIAGAIAVVKKPFDVELLLSYVEQYCGKST